MNESWNEQNKWSKQVNQKNVPTKRLIQHNASLLSQSNGVKTANDKGGLI